MVAKHVITPTMRSIHWLLSISIKLSCLLLTNGEIKTGRFGALCSPNLKLSRTPDVTLAVGSELDCAARCSDAEVFCVGFNYDQVAMSCDLFTTGALPTDCTDPEIVAAEGAILFENYVVSILCNGD